MILIINQPKFQSVSYINYIFILFIYHLGFYQYYSFQKEQKQSKSGTIPLIIREQMSSFDQYPIDCKNENLNQDCIIDLTGQNDQVSENQKIHSSSNLNDHKSQQSVQNQFYKENPIIMPIVSPQKTALPSYLNNPLRQAQSPSSQRSDNQQQDNQSTFQSSRISMNDKQVQQCQQYIQQQRQKDKEDILQNQKINSQKIGKLNASIYYDKINFQNKQIEQKNNLTANNNCFFDKEIRIIEENKENINNQNGSNYSLNNINYYDEDNEGKRKQQSIDNKRNVNRNQYLEKNNNNILKQQCDAILLQNDLNYFDEEAGYNVSQNKNIILPQNLFRINQHSKSNNRARSSSRINSRERNLFVHKFDASHQSSSQNNKDILLKQDKVEIIQLDKSYNQKYDTIQDSREYHDQRYAHDLFSKKYQQQQNKQSLQFFKNTPLLCNKDSDSITNSININQNRIQSSTIENKKNNQNQNNLIVTKPNTNNLPPIHRQRNQNNNLNQNLITKVSSGISENKRYPQIQHSHNNISQPFTQIQLKSIKQTDQLNNNKDNNYNKNNNEEEEQKQQVRTKSRCYSLIEEQKQQSQDRLNSQDNQPIFSKKSNLNSQRMHQHFQYQTLDNMQSYEPQLSIEGQDFQSNSSYRRLDQNRTISPIIKKSANINKVNPEQNQRMQQIPPIPLIIHQSVQKQKQKEQNLNQINKPQSKDIDRENVQENNNQNRNRTTLQRLNNNQSDTNDQQNEIRFNSNSNQIEQSNDQHQYNDIVQTRNSISLQQESLNQSFQDRENRINQNLPPRFMIDNMYNSFIAFQNALRQKPQGLKVEKLQKFKTTVFKKSQSEHLQQDAKQCSICLCEFEDEEQISFLACFHRFHSECINKWLETKPTCPLCKKDQNSLMKDMNQLLDHF